MPNSRLLMKAYYNDLRRISPKTIKSRAELIIKESTNSDGNNDSNKNDVRTVNKENYLF